MSARRRALCALLLLTLPACSKSPPPVAVEDAPLPMNIGAPLTDDECKQFCAELDKAVQAKDQKRFNQLFDWEALLDRITAGIPAAKPVRQNFGAGFRQSLNQHGGIASELFKSIEDGGHYRLLRIHTKDGEKRALYRQALGNEGVGYQEIVLARRADGKPYAIDIYIHATGELLSQTGRRLFLPLAAHANRNILERLTGAENELIKEQAKFQKLMQAVQAKQFPEILKLVKQLPPGLQKEKFFLLVRLQAAAEAEGDQEYLDALQALRQAYPNDPCLDLMGIDYYTLKKDFPQALQCVERLNQAVGGDPYLDIVRANLHVQAGDLAAARKTAEQAVKDFPDEDQPYWVLMTVASREKKFDEAIRWLTAMQAHFTVAPADLANDPDYADLVKSAAYKKWLKQQKK